MLLSSGDVCRIARIPPSVLHCWVRLGLLGLEYAGKKGHGNYRAFTDVQCLAVAAGAIYRKEQASGDRVNGVIRFLAGCTKERVEHELAQGRTIPAPAALLRADGVEHLIHNGAFVEPPKDVPPGVANLMRRIDLVGIYDRVMREIAKCKPATGRGRGHARPIAR